MIVITGATGNIGRPLVELLSDTGIETVAVSRREQVTDLPSGARHVRGDVGDAASLRTALTGADALFVLLGGELNIAGESPQHLVTAAREAGVKRLVLVTSQLLATRPDSAAHDRLRGFETAVRDSGLPHTILRPSGFASNAFAWADSVRTRRTIAAPFADVALPVIDPADIAAVAAAALTEDGHGGRDYVLTGPEAVSPRQQAALIATALGQRVDFVELTRAQAHAAMTRFMPEEVVTGSLDVLGEPLPTERAVSPDVERVLGRAANPFAAWVDRHIAAFGRPVR